MLLAQNSDSLNFKDSLYVQIHKLGFNDNIIMSIPMDTIVIDKEDGLFADDKNIIYMVPPNGFLTDNNRYGLTIINTKTGNEVSSGTEIIDDFSFSGQVEGLPRISFYNPNLIQMLIAVLFFQGRLSCERG